jgi:hypothetical protein
VPRPPPRAIENRIEARANDGERLVERARRLSKQGTLPQAIEAVEQPSGMAEVVP